MPGAAQGAESLTGGSQCDEGLDGLKLHNVHRRGKIDRTPPGEGDCKGKQRGVRHACGHNISSGKHETMKYQALIFIWSPL